MENNGNRWISIHFHAFLWMSMDIHGYWTAARGKEGAYDFCPRRQPIWELWTTVEYAGLPATTTTPGPRPTGAPLLAGPSLHDEVFARGQYPWISMDYLWIAMETH